MKILVCKKWKDLSPFVWRQKRKIFIRNYEDAHYIKSAVARCGKNITHLSIELVVCHYCGSYDVSCVCPKGKLNRMVYIKLLSHTANCYEHLQYLQVSGFHGVQSWTLFLNIVPKLPVTNLSTLNLSGNIFGFCSM